MRVTLCPTSSLKTSSCTKTGSAKPPLFYSSAEESLDSPPPAEEIVPTLSEGRRENHSPSRRGDNRYYVFLLDLDTIAFHDLRRVKESIRGFLEAGLTPEDRVMIANLSRGLHVRQNFTSSIPSLMHTLEKLPINPSRSSSFAGFIAEMEELFSSVPPFDLTLRALQILPPVVESLVSAAVAHGRSFLVNLDEQVNTASASLAALSTRLRSLPGRKQLIFFSGGYPLDAGSVLSRIIEDRAAAIYPNRTSIMLFVKRELRGLGYSSSLRLKLRSAIDQSNRSQVSIYSIDSRGLSAPSDASVRGSGSFSQFSSSLAEITAPQEFLTSLSLGTGGRSFVDSNDLGEGVRRAFLDRSEYYLVGFVPTARRRPGAFHSIKVKVNRPRLELRFRRSYIEEDKKSRANHDLLNALKFGNYPSNYPKNPCDLSVFYAIILFIMKKKNAPGRSEREGLSLTELFTLFPDDATAEKWFEKQRWPNGIACPECGSLRYAVVKNRKPMPYRCKDCRKYFSVRKGMVMQSSKLGYQKWAIAIYLVGTSLKGISSMKLHRELKVRQPTAWHLAQRIREGFVAGRVLMSGQVEVDETFIGGKERNKHPRKKLNAGRGSHGHYRVATLGILSYGL